MQRRLALLFLIIATLAFAQSDPFTGSFAGDQLQLQLRRAADGAYSGQLVFGGQTYPVSARPSGAGLAGSFSNQGHQFQFSVTQDSGGLRFITEGTTYRLARPAAAPAPAAAPSGVRPTSAPGRRHRHETGFGMTLPAGWTVKDNPEGAMMIPPGVTFDPNRQDNPEVYIAGRYGQVDPAGEQQLVQELSSAFVQSGVQVSRAGERQPIGQRAAVYYWEYRAPKHPPLLGLRIYVAVSGGRTFVVLGAGEAERVNTRDLPLREMLASMDFQQPKMPEGGALADNTPQAQEWLKKLQGKVIKQFSGGGGMTSERTRFLAADGTYSMRSSSLASIKVGPYGEAPTASASSISRNAQTGRWKIRDNDGQIFLQIWTSDGQTLMLRITRDARNWYLNGEKAFAVDP